MHSAWATWLYLGTAALFLLWTLGLLWHIRWVRRLPALASLPPTQAATPSKCSVVIAARDEEARIEQTLRYVLGQRGVELEVIVVDDRSKDRTGEIIQRLAREDARLQT